MYNNPINGIPTGLSTEYPQDYQRNTHVICKTKLPTEYAYVTIQHK